VVAVAHAHKIILPDDALEGAIRLIRSVAYDNKTSMQLDREKGRQTEADIMPGYLCTLGKKLRVPTPLHDEVYAQLK
jgi:2-dehydropantoate 2-reductase